jgi:predicted nucleic acid-binding Zn finger protein
VDKRAVVRLHDVLGARRYTVLAATNHCMCAAFVHNVIVKRSTLYCAHTLAARLAHALHKTQVRKMSDVDYTNLLGVDLNAA